MGNRIRETIGRPGLFLLARAGPGGAQIIIALLFAALDRGEGYLDLSLGFATGAIAANVASGWLAHYLVRVTPSMVDPVTLRRLVLTLLVGAGFVAAVGAAVLFAALGEEATTIGTVAVGAALTSIQLALSALLIARHQYLYRHRRLLAAEALRSVGALVAAATALGLGGSGGVVLVSFGLGGLVALTPFRGVLDGVTEAAEPCDVTRNDEWRAFLRGAARYGMPVVIASVCLLVIQFSDRAILSAVATDDLAARYSTAYDLINRPVGLVLGSIAMASQRQIFDDFDREPGVPTQRSRRDLTMQLVAAAGLGVAFCVMLSIGAIRDLVLAGQSFVVVILVFFGAVLLGVSHTLIRPLQARHRSGHVGWGAAIAAAVNLGSGIALVPALRATGAALSTVLAAALFVCLLLRADRDGT